GDSLRVTVSWRDLDERHALDAVLEDLREGIVSRLREVHCEVTPAFTVDVSYRHGAPADWAEGQRFALQLLRAGAAAMTQPAIVLTILKGQAAQDSFAFIEPVIR